MIANVLAKLHLEHVPPCCKNVEFFLPCRSLTTLPVFYKVP